MKLVDRAVSASRSLETKANGIAVLDLALIGVLATVAVEHRASAPWIAGVAIIAFALSLFFAWRVNSVEAHNLPGPITYNLPTIVNDTNNLAKIAQELTEAWDGYATDERNAGLQKAAWLRWAFRGMYIGIVAFATVTILSIFWGKDSSKVAANGTLSSPPTYSTPYRESQNKSGTGKSKSDGCQSTSTDRTSSRDSRTNRAVVLNSRRC
jgi:hypothetical protein